MAKSEKKIEARGLRRKGQSIKSIAHELEVSQGSVSLWCRNIVLTSQQLQVLEKNSKDPQYGRRLQNSLKQRGIRIEKTDRLRKEGIDEVGKLTKRELLIVGIALYWAEGYKKDSQVGLGSSDPKMMQLYVKWLQVCFGYSLNDLMFRVTVNESHEYRIGEIVKFWADLFEMDKSSFQKPFFQHAKWKKEYEHPEEYFGVLRIRVRKSSDFLRKIHGYIAGLKINV
jgi:predicted transcriptional regulator